MVSTNTTQTVPKGYHLAQLPDGQQVLVNDRSGNIAITDPYSGRVVGEVPPGQLNRASGGVARPNVPLQKGGAPIAIPPASGVPTTDTTYPPGVTNPGRAPTSGGGPASPTGQPQTTAVGSVGQEGQQRPGVGQAGYDIWAINDLLRDAGYNNWQIIGTTPIQNQESKANPLYDPNDPAGGPAAFTTPLNEYIINIRDPRTNAIKQLKLGRKWATPEGGQTSEDPGTGGDYSYQLQSLSDQQTKDKNVGHTGLMTIRGQIWGTNADTGAFELVPGAPEVPGDWSNIRQVEDKDGNQVWMGQDPKDHTVKEVPGMPSIPAAARAWGDPQLVDDGSGTGNKAWYGVDPADKQLKLMPNMPKVLAGPTGPTSISQQGVTYVRKPDGSYGPAQGVPDPRPPKGVTRVTLGDDGFLYQNVSNGDGTWQPDTTFTPVAYTDAAKAQQTKTGGLHQQGDKGIKVINGVSYPVVYRGGGDENYDVVSPAEGGKAAPYPGATPSSIVSTSTDQPFIVRHNYDTGKDEQVPNPNYQPSDPAKQVAQISQQATDKLTELQGRIGPDFTQEQAQAEYDRWWNTTVEPAKQQISQAQRQQALDAQLKASAEQRAIQSQRTSDYSTAAAAGQQAVANYQAQQKNMVGPNWGSEYFEPMMKAIQTGKPVGDIPASAFTYQGYDPNQLAQYYTAQALQHISPTAAQIANQNALPSIASLGPQLDPNALLNRSNYQFGAPQPQQPPPPQQGSGVTINVVGGTGAQPQAPVNAVPGQSYGAQTAYTGGIPPWNATPSTPAGQAYTPPQLSQYAGLGNAFGTYQPGF